MRILKKKRSVILKHFLQIFKTQAHSWSKRLRRLNQLGAANYVFPSATHTRFAHSIGCVITHSLLYESHTHTHTHSLSQNTTVLVQHYIKENITIFPKLHSLTYINDSVCWLAGELLDVLKQQSNICDLITERDELCVKVGNISAVLRYLKSRTFVKTSIKVLLLDVSDCCIMPWSWTRSIQSLVWWLVS